MPKQNKGKGRVYPSDLTEKQFERLLPYLPKAGKKAGKAGRPPADLKKVVDAILYVTLGGIQWRMLPKEYPHWRTVYGYYSRWSASGAWERINALIVRQVRCRTRKKRKGGGTCPRAQRPTAGVVDSQSVKAAMQGGDDIGYDGGKNVKGRKRFILTDTLGLLLAVKVTAASVDEREGAYRLIAKILSTDCLYKLCYRIKLVWADGGYSGQDLKQWVEDCMCWAWEVVTRKDGQKGFRVIPRRWVVERTFAWLSANRRLARDYERLPRNAEAFIYIAMIRLMLNRLD